MISGGCGILEGHSLVATRTYCIAVWVLLVSHAILFDPPISHEGRPGSRAPTGRVNALELPDGGLMTTSTVSSEVSVEERQAIGERARERYADLSSG
jgi:hypothetical protein